MKIDKTKAVDETDKVYTPDILPLIKGKQLKEYGDD